MKDEVQISVVMTVYNGEQYMQEAIDCILQQTCSCIELIIVNDTSTDRSEAIIRSYTDDRIVYLTLQGREMLNVETWLCR